MENKNKTLHYKRAQFSQSGGILQQMLSEAMTQLPKALMRREDIDDSQEHYRLLNQTSTERGSLCGVIFSYHKGHSQVVTAVEEDATSLDIKKYAPPEIKKGARSEFIEGLLYFCCSGNHLVLLASAALQSKQFEDYLNWLLIDRLTLLDKSNYLLIADPHKPDLTAGINEVKSITFKSELGGQLISESEHPLSNRKAKKLSFRPEGKEWDAISAMLAGFGVNLPNVRVEDGIYPQDIEVSLQIRCTKRRDRLEGATPFLDPIANAFRHHDKLPFELEFRDGSSVSGNDFKVSQIHSVACDEGIPDTTAVFKKMRNWLEQIIQNGTIISDAS
jgi:hypothetical protein